MILNFEGIEIFACGFDPRYRYLTSEPLPVLAQRQMSFESSFDRKCWRCRHFGSVMSHVFMAPLKKTTAFNMCGDCCWVYTYSIP